VLYRSYAKIEENIAGFSLYSIAITRVWMLSSMTSIYWTMLTFCYCVYKTGNICEIICKTQHANLLHVYKFYTIELSFKLVLRELMGHAVVHLVEALRYKPKGREFDSRWCHWIFSLI